MEGAKVDEMFCGEQVSFANILGLFCPYTRSLLPIY